MLACDSLRIAILLPGIGLIIHVLAPALTKSYSLCQNIGGLFRVPAGIFFFPPPTLNEEGESLQGCRL